MSDPSRRAILAGLAASLAPGCGGLRRFPFDDGLGTTLRAAPDALMVQFIGVGCCLLQRGSTAVLTDPFWSHLPLGRVAFGRVEPDLSQVPGHHPILDRVQAVVVGHGHYDHVLDLPWVLEEVHPEARVLASNSVVHQYAAMGLARPILGVDDWRATPDSPGRWWTAPDGRMRILPIASDHPAQWAGVHLYTKDLSTDARRPPRRAGDFQEGPTLAFLIDFLDERRIVHRVFVESSSTGPPDGQVPDSVLAERKVDLALLSMDVARDAAAHRPSILDHIHPDTVIGLHWENFFRPKTRPPREVMKVNLPKIREGVQGRPERWLFPSWDAVFRFADPAS